MSEHEITKSFCSKKHLAYLFFNFEGRVDRQEYILGSFILLILLAINFTIIFLVNKADAIGIYPSGWVTNTTTVLTFFITPLIAIMHLAVQIKRIHDFNYSGLWLLLACVLLPLYFVVLGVLIFIPGSLTENKYGPPSKY